MGLGTTILLSVFSADLSNVYRTVFFFFYLMYAISTLLLLLAGKLVEYPRLLLISPRSLKLCTICKSPLHGPRNYVDRMWEGSVNLIQYTHLFLLVLLRQTKNPLVMWLSTELGVNSRMTSKR